MPTFEGTGNIGLEDEQNSNFVLPNQYFQCPRKWAFIPRSHFVSQVLCCFWRERSVRGGLQRVLLCHQARDWRVRPHAALLFLHGEILFSGFVQLLQVIMVATFWLLTGTIGFYAAYTFIRKIYGAVKIDWVFIDLPWAGNCDFNLIFGRSDSLNKWLQV